MNYIDAKEITCLDFEELKIIFKTIEDPQEKINRINMLYRIIKTEESTPFITKIVYLIYICVIVILILFILILK